MSIATPLTPPASEPSIADAKRAYAKIRSFSERLCATLSPEDMVVQSMPDASPIRWHLAHTTWFFEVFILKEFDREFRPYNKQFEFLFNSYYNAVGEQFTRADRGLLTRPSVSEVFAYRQAIDEKIDIFLDATDDETWQRISHLFQVGLQHEQQHQELMLTDVKHLFSRNPLAPAFCDTRESTNNEGLHTQGRKMQYRQFEEQIAWIGHDGGGFCYDNELPRHRQFVKSFEIADRLATNREYLEFINDRGYERPELWLSIGWQHVQQSQCESPIYWLAQEKEWSEFTLTGLQPLDLEAPVCHLSYFEADAFARWSGARLPTEAEWEIASNACQKQETLSSRSDFIRQHQMTKKSVRCLEIAGSGRVVHTLAILATNLQREPSASTTESLCVTNTCCAVGVLQPASRIFAARIVTSFRRTLAGSSPALGWLETLRDERWSCEKFSCLLTVFPSSLLALEVCCCLRGRYRWPSQHLALR